VAFDLIKTWFEWELYLSFDLTAGSLIAPHPFEFMAKSLLMGSAYNNFPSSFIKGYLA
jgi:hypothetical protein